MVTQIKSEASLWVQAGNKNLAKIVGSVISEYSLCFFPTGLAHAPRPGCVVVHHWCTKDSVPPYNALTGNVLKLFLKKKWGHAYGL
jgi:hypothetical protein